MRFAILLISFTSLPVFADYYSSKQIVDEQYRAQQAQQAVVDTRAANDRILSAINYIGRAHRGFSSQPAVRETSENGYNAVVSFSTGDGWDCESRYGNLLCANVELRKSFKAYGWIAFLSSGGITVAGDSRGFFPVRKKLRHRE